MNRRSFLAGTLLGGIFCAGLFAMLPTSQAQENDAEQVLSFEAIPTQVVLPDTEHFAALASQLRAAEKTDAGWLVKGAYFRAKVDGGWIVSPENGGPFFMPDAGHRWSGGSLR